MQFDSSLYDHFNLRLQERYGISCTVDEWKALGFSQLGILYPVHHNGKGMKYRSEGGTLEFKGKTIHVIRRVNTNLLVTALPPIRIHKIKKPRKKIDFKLIR